MAEHRPGAKAMKLIYLALSLLAMALSCLAVGCTPRAIQVTDHMNTEASWWFDYCESHDCNAKIRAGHGVAEQSSERVARP
jgi:hypothetical protein